MFYRAMHIVQSAVSRQSSVCSSVRPSVTLRYRGRHIGCVSSKVITRAICLGSSLHGSPFPNIGELVQGTPRKFGRNRGAVAVFSRKPAVSLKQGKIKGSSCY